MEDLLGCIESLLDLRHSSISTGGMKECIRFLKNFIRLVTLLGLEPKQMGDLLIHVRGVLIDVACFIFRSLNPRYDDYSEWSDPYKLVDRIEPVESQVFEIYVRALQQASALPESSNQGVPGCQKLLLADFVDSLIYLIFQLLFHRTGCLYHKMYRLYKRLRFLRTVLTGQHGKGDELHDKMNGLTGILICEAGVIVCYLFLGKKERLPGGTLEHRFQNFDEKFKLVINLEEEEEEDAPRYTPPSECPQMNLLGFLDSILEKMTSNDPCEAADSVVASAKNKLKTIRDELAYLRSFLVNVMEEQHDQRGKLQDLWSRVATVAYETEFVLDSLQVGGTHQSFTELLDTIIAEIKQIKTQASGIEKITKVKDIAKTYNKQLSAGKNPEFSEPVVCLIDESQEIIDRLKRGTENLDIVSIVGMSEDDLGDALRKYLKGKRYLVILDDVWDAEVWRSLKYSFPNDRKGSRILLTSRSEDVALEIKPDSKPHRLRFLNKPESWELFQMKMCFEEGCPPELLARGEAIASGCKGLPLMIIVVAGILSNMEPGTWEEIEIKLKKGNPPTTDECNEILELSYRHLPDYLKPCFLYFGLYKEDQKVSVHEMLWLWIAEGIAKKSEEECVEDVAEGYMMELIQRNLIMVAERGSRGSAKSCILHDLLLDFAGKQANKNILCIAYAAMNLVLPFSQGCCTGCISSLSKLLRVLSLNKIFNFHFFPSAIQLLGHLRYLALAIERSVNIPSSIAYLSNLETFIVLGMKEVFLPYAVWNMKKLRHMRAHSWVFVREFPAENPNQLSSLDSLHTFKENDGALKILALDFLSRLESLHITCTWPDKCIYHFQFPENLKKLTLSLLMLPWSDMSAIHRLPNLEVLKLLGNAFSGETWHVEEDTFPKLRYLILEGLNLVRWTMDSEDNVPFPCLEKLVLKRCMCLEELPTDLAQSSTLQTIEVFECDKVTESINQLQEMAEEGNEGLKILTHILWWKKLSENETGLKVISF
ncbi:OLC1v1005930C1 [Oldenlandia corymbosa var. corymbosa]|uniref:OLC1v1005930C1 n=1 Tax=Oldenlandia corymbosa var. corymbosa TaxID=529605 RepID=A0AAV1DGG0_OLDCO|nr:OLC1v1005930C1 [Oldenlandia corymbosa var. corymbosa]